MTGYSVTYELWSPEDLEIGDTDDRGFISQGVSLRDAIDDVTATDSIHCEQQGIDLSSWPADAHCWLTVYNSADYISGVSESRSLHFPKHITASSRRRVARLLGKMRV